MNKWISVKDKLPDEAKEVLAALYVLPVEDGEECQMDVLMMSDHPKAWTGDHDPESGCNWYVTHWMPIPEPPSPN